MSILNTALFKGFTFGGVNSLDYDIYITGEGVYNAPERAVEKVSVPGRNGDLTIDQGRFENVPVTYAKCGCAAKTQAELAEKVAAFRNALCSRVGYKRLTDDYNKDEYRMAMYVSGLEVEAVAQHRMGTFDIVFDAMPQRFLLSGEVPKVVAQNMTPSSTKTESGSVVSIESDGGDAVTSLIAQITPTQAGSGDPSPSNVRPIAGWAGCNVYVAGKNLLRINNRTQSQYGVTFISNNGVISVSGTATLTVNFYTEIIAPATGNYYFGGAPSGHNNKVDIYVWDIAANARAKKWDGTTNSVSDFGATMNNEVRLEKGKRYYVTCRVYKDATINDVFHPMLRLASETDDTYEPYTGNIYPVSFGDAGTVYGGTLDVVTGVLTMTHKMVDLGTLDWSYRTNYAVPVFYYGLLSDMPLNTPLLCEQYTQTELTPNSSPQFPNYGIYNRHWFASAHNLFIRDDRYTDAASFKSAVSGVKLVYELATPQTYNLTAQEVELLTGQNNVWADTGDITLTYGADPYKVVNPTLFASKPLLRVTGHGVLTIGSQSITISGTSSTQVINIDCDTMEAWEMSGSAMVPRNDYIQNAGDDFPKLKPGANKITLGVGITQVVVTPRWWRV